MKLETAEATAHPRFGQDRRRYRRVLAQSTLPYRLGTLAVFVLAWHWFAASTDSLLIAGPLQTAAGTLELALEPRFWDALYLSNQAMVLGFGISLVLGVPMGFALGRYPAIESFVNPYLGILLVFPAAAIIPILLMSVGIGLAARVILVVIMSLVFIVINVRAGMREVDPRLIEMAQSFGASERQMWQKILLPGSLPAVMAGVRVGLGRAVEGMVLAELLMVAVGLGNLIVTYRGTFQPHLMYATIVYIILEGLLLISVARWVEWRATPWAQARALRRRATA